MKNISLEQINDIRSRIDIVNVVSSYLPLEKKGRNFFGLCPFHDDHNPSMSVSPEKQIYTCFVCGASGNVFNFVMQYEKLPFLETVKKLAASININIDIASNDKKPLVKENQKLYEMYQLSEKFFQNNLLTAKGNNALKYLEDRNLNLEIIKEFKIGVAFNDNHLSELFTNKMINKKDLLESGLLVEKNGDYYDIFQNRIIFPLWDLDGNPIGFSGRIYDNSSQNKYVNTMETPIFKKGQILYNFHRAKEAARQKKQIIIVEGFMDVIRLASVGIKNVVATMGTAITKEQASLMRRLSEQIILCFDGDSAGAKATLAATVELEKKAIHPKIIRLEDNYDPDDYIIKKGVNFFEKHLQNPMNAFDFKLDYFKNNYNLNDNEEVVKYVKDLIPEIENETDKLIKELNIKKLSEVSGLKETTITELLSNKEPTTHIIDKPKEVLKISKWQKAENTLIFYMLKSIDVIKIYDKNISYLPDDAYRDLGNEILYFYKEYEYFELADFITYLNDNQELIDLVTRIGNLNYPDTYSTEQIKDCIKVINDHFISEEIKKLDSELRSEVIYEERTKILQKIQDLKKKELDINE